MRSYVLPEIERHEISVVFLAGYGFLAMLFIQLLIEYQMHGSQPLARRTRFILPQAPMRREKHVGWYSIAKLDQLPGGGDRFDITELLMASQKVKEYIAYEHVKNNVPLSRIAAIGVCHGGGLLVFSALVDLIENSSAQCYHCHKQPIVIPGHKLSKIEIRKHPLKYDFYPTLPAAYCLQNYPIDMTKLAAIGSFVSRMPGVAVLDKIAQSQPPEQRTSFPRLYILHGTKDQIVPMQYHKKTLHHIRSIYEKCGGDYDRYVSYKLVNRLNHSYSAAHFLDFSQFISTLIPSTNSDANMFNSIQGC